MALRTKSSKPAKYRNAVIVACDEAFVPYASFLLNQILQLEKERDFDICLVSQDSYWNLSLVASNKVRFIHLLNYDTVGALPTHEFLSVAAYIRLFLPAILSEDYDRILYLDSDIFLNRAGLSKLFETDMENHAVAAVLDIYRIIHPRRPMPDFKALGLKGVAYLNSGVLLIDCKRFKEVELERRCMEFVHNRPDVAEIIGDQSALNCVLRGDWKELHPKWNWMYNIQTTSLVESESPYIIHFIGHTKPWRRVNGETPRKYYDAYMDYLTAEFPHVAEAFPPYEITNKTKRRLRRYMLKGWFNHPKYRRYFDRLENDRPAP